MTDVIQQFTANQLRGDLPALRAGQTVRVHQKIQEKEKERIQIFEGVILGIHAGTTINATVTVRKVSNGVGVERVFPLHSPSVEKFEVIKQERVRQSKLYFLRKDNRKRKVKEDRDALEKIQKDVASAEKKIAEELKAQKEQEDLKKKEASTTEEVPATAEEVPKEESSKKE